MKRSLYPAIDDSYEPKAESADTIERYYNNNNRVTDLLFSAQFVVPPLAMVCLILFVSHYFPSFVKEHNKTESEKRE